MAKQENAIMIPSEAFPLILHVGKNKSCVFGLLQPVDESFPSRFMFAQPLFQSYLDYLEKNETSPIPTPTVFHSPSRLLSVRFDCMSSLFFWIELEFALVPARDVMDPNRFDFSIIRIDGQTNDQYPTSSFTITATRLDTDPNTLEIIAYDAQVEEDLPSRMYVTLPTFYMRPPQ